MLISLMITILKIPKRTSAHVYSSENSVVPTLLPSPYSRGHCSNNEFQQRYHGSTSRATTNLVMRVAYLLVKLRRTGSKLVVRSREFVKNAYKRTTGVNISPASESNPLHVRNRIPSASLCHCHKITLKRYQQRLSLADAPLYTKTCQELPDV
jgi:hypothetical protein